MFNAQVGLRCMALAGHTTPVVPGLWDPMVAGWMLHPDDPLAHFSLPNLLIKHNVVPASRAQSVESHGVGCVGSSASCVCVCVCLCARVCVCLFVCVI